jgi:hypothetical protein
VQLFGDKYVSRIYVSKGNMAVDKYDQEFSLENLEACYHVGDLCIIGRIIQKLILENEVGRCQLD